MRVRTAVLTGSLVTCLLAAGSVAVQADTHDPPPPPFRGGPWLDPQGERPGSMPHVVPEEPGPVPMPLLRPAPTDPVPMPRVGQRAEELVPLPRLLERRSVR